MCSPEATALIKGSKEIAKARRAEAQAVRAGEAVQSAAGSQGNVKPTTKKVMRPGPGYRAASPALSTNPQTAAAKTILGGG